jgi:pimeloyl-ACP methyl ester carboxylesterase
MKQTAVLLSLLLSAASPVRAEEDHPILLLSEDESFHFELLMPLAEAVYGGADVGPVLGAANNITAGDFDSFSEALRNLAFETKAAALDPDAQYDPINVRETWFSAATYFRRADFYLHGNWSNPLINSLWDEQLAAFDTALAALPVPGQRLQIEADNFTVEAIWYSVSSESYSPVKRPTLVLGNGYDGAQEDLYHNYVVPALARGWNCITYEGPGQPKVRRDQDLGFIYDWERVVTPVIDWLYEEKEESIDTERLVLLGLSFGGYLAARAGAYDDRIKALVLNGGIYDTFESWSSFLPAELLETFNNGDKETFDQIVSPMIGNPEVPSTVRWGLEQGLWSFNVESPYDFLKTVQDFSVANITDRINVPTFIADAEFEGFFAGQGQKVKDALGDLATLHLFTGPAGYHCQIGAFQELNRVLFSWLHKTLG